MFSFFYFYDQHLTLTHKSCHFFSPRMPTYQLVDTCSLSSIRYNVPCFFYYLVLRTTLRTPLLLPTYAALVSNQVSVLIQTFGRKVFSPPMDGLHFEPTSVPGSPSDSFSSISLGSPFLGPTGYNNLREYLFKDNCAVQSAPSPIPTLPPLAPFESISNLHAAEILCSLTGNDVTGRMNSLPQPFAPSFYTSSSPVRSQPDHLRTYTTLQPPAATSTPAAQPSHHKVRDLLPIPTNTEAVLWYNRAQQYQAQLERSVQACRNWELKFRRQHMGASCSKSCQKCRPTSPTTKP